MACLAMLLTDSIYISKDNFSKLLQEQLTWQ